MTKGSLAVTVISIISLTIIAYIGVRFVGMEYGNHYVYALLAIMLGFKLRITWE